MCKCVSEIGNKLSGQIYLYHIAVYCLLAMVIDFTIPALVLVRPFVVVLVMIGFYYLCAQIKIWAWNPGIKAKVGLD